MCEQCFCMRVFGAQSVCEERNKCTAESVSLVCETRGGEEQTCRRRRRRGGGEGEDVARSLAREAGVRFAKQEEAAMQERVWKHAECLGAKCILFNHHLHQGLSMLQAASPSPHLPAITTLVSSAPCTARQRRRLEVLPDVKALGSIAQQGVCADSRVQSKAPSFKALLYPHLRFKAL